MSRRITIVMLLAFFVFLFCKSVFCGSALEPVALAIPPLVSPKFIVHKQQRTLELFSDKHLIRIYKIALGTNPVGSKERAGDRRTPEGEYYVCEKNAHSHFYLSLGLSYPNAEDAGRALQEHRITKSQYNLIINAIRRKGKPPWNTPLGGEIMVHGGGTGSDWTWGCIALDNSDIKELFEIIPIGTPVEIDQ